MRTGLTHTTDVVARGTAVRMPLQDRLRGPHETWAVTETLTAGTNLDQANIIEGKRTRWSTRRASTTPETDSIRSKPNKKRRNNDDFFDLEDEVVYIVEAILEENDKQYFIDWVPHKKTEEI